MINKLYTCLLFSLFLFGCTNGIKSQEQLEIPKYLKLSKNSLEYAITPKNKYDKEGLMFSDQGAWFAYGFNDTLKRGSFSGPFLMTQQNGIWASKCLAYLTVEDQVWNSQKKLSYNSHLVQVLSNNQLELTQILVFLSGHTALIRSKIKNIGTNTLKLSYNWKNEPILADSLNLSIDENTIKITSKKSNAIGYLRFPREKLTLKNNLFSTKKRTVFLKPGESYTTTVSQSFIFQNYNWSNEKTSIIKANFSSVLRERMSKKDNEIQQLVENRRTQFTNNIYAKLLAKTHLTLQNNWRIPAGEITYEGLFPSYHYKWFNGFWSWDSWKHAVGLSYYKTDLAKKQIKLMFEFQNDDGFVADCVYRDTTIEAHNYRDTKPPLSAWAVAKVFEKSKDTSFINYMYPKLKNYHYWWYNKRDHDGDGLCEYGSTDGSLVAAKWESGMDNAIRFDNAKILKNSDGAYSLNQESVDLNAYLYAEKQYLERLAGVLNNNEDVKQFREEAKVLKTKIQKQFYDGNDGWFYDTTLDGATFIKGEGSEGWTALWANAATQKQAEMVKNRMMNPQKFYTKVPFQTMSADHEKFNPENGYWRGPNWLDQSYFGVKGLRNYGFNKEADLATKQILQGAEGLLKKGISIRENYHPLTGKGLYSHNFSWSAAHIIMLLLEE